MQMSETKVDHAGEAERLLEEARMHSDPGVHMRAAANAQVHATLALVERQEVMNGWMPELIKTLKRVADAMEARQAPAAPAWPVVYGPGDSGHCYGPDFQIRRQLRCGCFDTCAEPSHATGTVKP